MRGMATPTKGDLVIAETATSTWHYHLRQIGDEGFKPGGLLPQYPALCGARLGWDTEIPLSTWGKRSDHIPEHFCQKCERGPEKGFRVVQS